MKKKIIYFLIITIVILLCILFIFLYTKKEKNESVKIINFYTNGAYIYEMKLEENYILVTKIANINCSEPCEQPKIDSYKIEYNDENIKVIENLFKDKESYEISISKSDLTEQEQEIIDKIINRLSYHIINNKEEDSTYIKRGYYIQQLDDEKVIITIAMGMKNTGGYDISIKEVNVIEDEVQIFVQEESPFGEATMAFTYPIVQIEFNKMPEEITIQNFNTFEEFELINLE